MTIANFRVCIIGDEKVGKTSITSRLHDDTFPENTSYTVGFDIVTKKYPQDPSNIALSMVKLRIFDIAGKPSFLDIIKPNLKEASAFVLVFDLTNRKSFTNLSAWIKIAREACHKAVNIYLIANKYDLSESIISDEEIMAFARKEGLLCSAGSLGYTQVSAKNSEKVTIDSIFQHIVDQLISPPKNNKPPTATSVKPLHPIEQYIASNRKRIFEGFEPYTKQQKEMAAMCIKETVLTYISFPPEHFLNPAFLNDFRNRFIIPLSDGNLAKIFEDMLYPKADAPPFHSDELIVAIFQLEFALGAFLTYDLRRQRLIDSIRFAFGNELIRAFKLKASAAVRDALQGIKKLADVKREYAEAFYPGDRLTLLVEGHEKRGSFGLHNKIQQIMAERKVVLFTP